VNKPEFIKKIIDPGYLDLKMGTVLQGSPYMILFAKGLRNFVMVR
jgi:hypothetical protein